MVTGNISIVATPAYVTEQQWRDKYGISTADESSAQFIIDSREAHFQVRREAYYLVRERILFKDSNNVAYFPMKWIADGTMNKTVDKSDLLVYQLAADGLSFDSVSPDEITSVDPFNNSILFDSGFAPTRQLYVTYYTCGKPYDEVAEDELKRAVSAYITIITIQRLRKSWGLKGDTGWSAGGVTVNKDITSYKELLQEAEAEYKKYISFLKPFVGRKARTGQGGEYQYGPNVAYSSQVLARQRIRRTFI